MVGNRSYIEIGSNGFTYVVTKCNVSTVASIGFITCSYNGMRRSLYIDKVNRGFLGFRKRDISVFRRWQYNSNGVNRCSSVGYKKNNSVLDRVAVRLYGFNSKYRRIGVIIISFSLAWLF